jgi:hypothetical protein
MTYVVHPWTKGRESAAMMVVTSPSFAGVSPLITLQHRHRFASPPWHRLSPQWLSIDLALRPDHLARFIDRAVSLLDLQPLYDSYHGVGSLPNPPDLLLKIVLFEMHDGELRPARWARHCRECTPLQWLAFGLQPARSCLYTFRDRLGPLLDDLNACVLAQAQADGIVCAQRGALDGTFVAAQGSRHKLINHKTMHKRLSLLEAVIDQDAAQANTASAATPPPPSPLCIEAVSRANTLPVDPSAVQQSANVSLLASPAAAVAAATGASALLSKETPLLECVVSLPASAPDSAPAAVAGSAASVTQPTTTSTPPACGKAAASSAEAAATLTDKPAWMANTPATRQRQYATYQKAQKRLQELQRHHEKTNSRKAKSKRRPADRVVICPSEPEAALGVDKRKTFRPLYNLQIAYDLDSPFILGYEVFSQATDAGLLPPTLQRVQRLTGRLPKEILADGIYATALDLAWCDQTGVILYAPMGVAATAPATVPASASDAKGQTPAVVEKVPTKGLLGKESFTWLQEKQTYQCPQGHLLDPFRTTTEKRGQEQSLVVYQYRCAAVHCQTCPLASACTRSPKKGRTIKRHEHEGLVEALQKRMASAEAQELYRLRKQTVERIFADLRRHRGLEQLRSYGRARAQIQMGLLVLAHNALALAQQKGQQPPAATLEVSRA